MQDTQVDTAPKYPEMVGFLKGLRLAGKQINCRLSADYSTVRAEYERLLSEMDDKEEDDNTPQQSATYTPSLEGQPALPEFTEVKVLEFPSEGTVEVQIDDEVRLLNISWDDTTESGVTIKPEVAVMCERDGSQHIKICKLEVFLASGVYKAYPLCKYGGKVEWCYPGAETKYVRVKGYLTPNSSNWRWVEVDMSKSNTDTVTSQSVTVCRSLSDEKLGITKRFPLNGVFQKIGGRWIFDKIDDAQVTWISVAQDSIAYKYKIGEMVYLQSEYGDSKLAAFQITNLQYSKLLLTANLRCVMGGGNGKWHRGDTTVQPVVQLVHAKSAHTA